ncbi:MAG: TGS domain-containing protein, partial [Bacteroidales bacterium]|nr:TGS domain-containing protein [Bacteroidales bacterium]
MIQITLPDNSIKQFDTEITGMDVAKSISEGLARNSLAIGVNGKTQDLLKPIKEDASIKIYTWNDVEGKATMWHSSAHIMAAAIEILYPGVKFGIGPDIENGFYYDVDFLDYTLTQEDLLKIEKKMMELISQKHHFDYREVSKAESIKYFTEKGDEYKLELINELEDGTISFYQTGDFVDLCRGPHLPDTSFIKAIKLTAIAGAYWRGDEKRKQLTRVYG